MESVETLWPSVLFEATERHTESCNWRRWDDAIVILYLDVGGIKIAKEAQNGLEKVHHGRGYLTSGMSLFINPSEKLTPSEDLDLGYKTNFFGGSIRSVFSKQ